MLLKTCCGAANPANGAPSPVLAQDHDHAAQHLLRLKQVGQLLLPLLYNSSAKRNTMSAVQQIVVL